MRHFTALRGRYLCATSLRYVDDTWIEPVTPTMSILAYAVLRVSRVLTSNAFTLN